MSRTNSEYQAYLLRLLPTRHNETVTWRATIQRVDGGERLAFENVDMLFDYLRQQTELEVTNKP